MLLCGHDAAESDSSLGMTPMRCHAQCTLHNKEFTVLTFEYLAEIEKVFKNIVTCLSGA